MTTYPSPDIEREAAAVLVRPLDASPRALVRAVLPASSADDAGFEPGCYVTTVDGQPVRDAIDWRWLSADNALVLGYIDLDGDEGEVELERDEGEDWGFDFEGVVFDGVKQCRNACTFCFMRQLPDDMRPSLTLRDDDFRLSFMSGTFVTFTNLMPDDEARIVEQHISPLRVSLHASNADVRRRMIGKHAQHGIDVLDRLLSAGIEFHAQIVLVPDQNDGAVLEDTLSWAYARPGILDVCIVPLGFTKHQTRFERSFNDPVSSHAAMDTIIPFQQRALVERGTMWAFAADEFYHNAYGHTLLENLPPADHYGDFAMFEDGVGLIRSFVDEWETAEREGLVDRAAQALEWADMHVHCVSGCATREFLSPLIARGALASRFAPLFVKNDFFGGNVDVTGLLCATDMIPAIQGVPVQESASNLPAVVLNGAPQASSARAKQSSGPFVRAGLLSHTSQQARESRVLYAIPEVIFNDDNMTLDDMTLEDMENETGAWLAVVSCTASEYLREIIDLAERIVPTPEHRSNL